jgi:hypothetical protein
MGPEFWVGLAAVFVCGGAVGTAGTLLSQWVVRKLTGPELSPMPPLSHREMELLRSEITDLSRMVENLDARLEFQEQLLGGGLPTTRAPRRLSGPTPADPSDSAQPHRKNSHAEEPPDGT